MLLWKLKKIYRVSKETATKPAKCGERPNVLLFSVYICMEYFLPGEGPPNNWEGMHLSLSLSQLSRRANGLELREGEC